MFETATSVVQIINLKNTNYKYLNELKYFLSLKNHMCS